MALQEFQNVSVDVDSRALLQRLSTLYDIQQHSTGSVEI
jgi:hypothetical protein